MSLCCLLCRLHGGLSAIEILADGYCSALETVIYLHLGNRSSRPFLANRDPRFASSCVMASSTLIAYVGDQVSAAPQHQSLCLVSSCYYYVMMLTVSRSVRDWFA
jgi:hypothetical protein